MSKTTKAFDSNSILLSTTPLEMEDNFNDSNIYYDDSKQSNNQINSIEQNMSSNNESADNSELLRASELELEQKSKIIEEQAKQLTEKDSKMADLLNEIEALREANRAKSGADSNESNDKLEIASLNRELDAKQKKLDELDQLLRKQINLSESLSNQLSKSNEKIDQLETTIREYQANVAALQSENQALNQEIISIKFEMSTKGLQEENYLKVSLLNKFRFISSVLCSK